MTSSVPVPEGSKPNTPEGATAFARWYIEQTSKAGVDWDTSAVQAYADDSCVTCKGVADAVQEWKEFGYRHPSPRYEFQASQVGPGPTPDTLDVDLMGRDRAAPILGADGSVVEQLPDKDVPMRITVRWDGSGWKVQQIQAILR